VAGRFKGKRVLVTGAGSGLGLALARAFAQEDAHVVLAGRNVDRLAEATAGLVGAGFSAEATALDVADKASVRAVFKALGDDGPLDVLVHNAGLATFGPFLEGDGADDDRMLAVNLGGVIDVTRAALPLFRRRGGAIVGVASMVARRTLPNCAVYSATKAGLVAFLAVLREELRPRGIRVLAAMPGPVDTPLWNRIEGDFPRERMMTAADCAQAIVEATKLDGTAAVEELVLLPEGGPL
jgi:short-subunit dehydrogenase